MNMYERIYYASPYFFQNALVSLYGATQYPKRYQNIRKILDLINETESLSNQRKIEFQQERLNNILCYASNNIPYYQKLFAEYGYSSRQFTSISDLEKLPTLSKKTVIDNYELFFPEQPQKVIKQRTSGTTGTPFNITMNKETYQLKMALLVFHEMNHGVRLGARRATFAGRLIKKYEQTTPPHFRYNLAENQAIFSTYHLSRETFEEYHAELSRFKPEEIIGYPSALYNLACLYIAHGMQPDLQLKCIVTNSETLFDWQRTIIEDVFNCRVFDYYGTAEHLVFAAEMAEGGYRVNPNLGILEIVDSGGSPVPAGKVIGTTLTNTAMPLIRFEIGDTAEKEADFTISSFTGRVDDQIITPDGRTIGRSGEIFGYFDNIKEAQIIQRDIDHCELLIVKNHNQEQIADEKIKEKFRSKFGASMKVSITLTDCIPRTSNGKFKAVIGLEENGPVSFGERSGKAEARPVLDS